VSADEKEAIKQQLKTIQSLKNQELTGVGILANFIKR
jgi:hypothetical protein